MLRLGGQTHRARNGGLLRIPAFNGDEKGGAEESSGTEKKRRLLIEEASTFRWIYSYLACRYPTSLLCQFCFFFLNTNQIQLVRLVSLFKMKMRTTIRTATFTCSRTNNQNNILQQEEKMDAHRSCFILTVLVTVDGMIKKRSNTEF